MRFIFFPCKPLALATLASTVPFLLTGATLDDAATLAELSRMGCEIHVEFLTDGQTIERVKMGEELSDDLFAQLGKLRHLSALNLWLPTEHSGAASLRGLVSLCTLRELVLTGPDVDDQIAQYIGAMTNLESLELRSVSISETGLVRLADLKALKRFELSDLKPITHGGLQTIATLVNLEEISIVGNCERGALLRLKSLEKLATISLGGKQVDHQLAELRTWPRLKKVSISRATITAAVADSLLAIHNLEELELGCCDIEPEAATRMQSLHLKRLACYGADSKAYEQLLKALGSELWDLHASSDK